MGNVVFLMSCGAACQEDGAWARQLKRCFSPPGVWLPWHPAPPGRSTDDDTRDLLRLRLCVSRFDPSISTFKIVKTSRKPEATGGNAASDRKTTKGVEYLKSMLANFYGRVWDEDQFWSNSVNDVRWSFTWYEMGCVSVWSMCSSATIKLCTQMLAKKHYPPFVIGWTNEENNSDKKKTLCF